MDFEKKAKLYKVCCDILKKEIENLDDSMFNRNDRLIEVCPAFLNIVDNYEEKLVYILETE